LAEDRVTRQNRLAPRPGRHPHSEFHYININEESMIRSRLKMAARLFVVVAVLCQGTAQGEDTSGPGNSSQAVVPAGTVLQIRLRQTISSYGSKRDSPILAEVIAPVVVDGRTILPMRTELQGRIRDVRKVGLGLSRETALLDLEFNRIKFPGQAEQDLVGKVSKVDDARETVDAAGRIRGIRATETFAHTLAGVAIAASAFDPMALLFSLSSSLSIFRLPDSSIILPTGAELHFEVGADLPVSSPAPPPFSDLIDSEETRNLLQSLVRPLPFRTATEGRGEPSDVTSLLYFGTPEAIEKAFLAAGWVRSDQLNTQSTYGVMRSVIENQGYQAAPMSVLLLDNQQPALTFAKTLNTFFSRHHLRLYPQEATFRGKKVWTSTATYDTGIGFAKSAKTFIHVINENIDEEREKVVNDLVLTGCVTSVGYLDRPWVPRDAKNATGDFLRTDGKIAILDISECANPVRADVAADELPEVTEKLPAYRRPFRTAFLTLRNDFTRGNIFYQSYAGTRMAIGVLKKPDPDQGDNKSVHYGGQEFMIVQGSKPNKSLNLPGDPGRQLYEEEEKRRPKSYVTRLMFSFNGGFSTFANDLFTTLPTTLVVTRPEGGEFRDPFDIHTSLADGWSISPKVTLNSWRHVSNEFSYSRSVTKLHAFGQDQLLGFPVDVTGDAVIRRFTYNTIVHLRPNGSRFRPYAAVGPTFQLIHLQEAQSTSNSLLKFTVRDVALLVSAYSFGKKPPLEGGGIFQVGLDYGGGAIFQLTPRIFFRADFRETLSKQPNWWSTSAHYLAEGVVSDSYHLEVSPVILHEPLRHQLFTIGIGLSF